ncbi:U3 small nucleolar ribonucleoprotein LCP5 [Kwoniella heveanensis BCC8398]|uniref:U3 small nucleolar ribonucleoprotein LCP5 n=1 Tax=Kwoniella heveanensis BCC8398 TaxID=1296120 RepID=A0A1B9GQ06_9TREE|nr:U3 small nucleolar ribonucleoprotein LCP5 [Kwoniella heveanensis BCC8398]
MDSDTTKAILSTEEVLKLFSTIQTSVEATTSSSTPLLTKVRRNDESLDFSSGLSLLLLRPQLLLSSLHNLIITLSLRLLNPSLPLPSSEDLQSALSLSTPFTAPRAHQPTDNVEEMLRELGGELVLTGEVMDKIRGMEGKLEYQIKKLVGLAEAEEQRGKAAVEGVEEDPLSFRPNPSAIVASAREPSSTKPTRKGAAGIGPDDEGEGEGSNQIYRPPRVAAVPYLDSARGDPKQRTRQAPALLSEFAASLDATPMLESTSGLSTRPVSNRATNSISAKRAAELKRINEFEEENMTRLVTSKREAKRRQEDEAALAMGFGVGPSRGRRGRNGLEAELEGVLGDRGSKGVWDGVSSLGKRGDVLERGKKRISDDAGGAQKRKKGKTFERDLKRRRK